MERASFIFIAETERKDHGGLCLVFALRAGEKKFGLPALKEGKSGEILALSGMKQVDLIEGYDFFGFAAEGDKAFDEAKDHSKKTSPGVDQMASGSYERSLWMSCAPPCL
jgi:hypothetical protein